VANEKKMEKEFICTLNSFFADECYYFSSYSKECSMKTNKGFASISCPHRMQATELPINLPTPAI
jgi:hypothetical protein